MITKMTKDQEAMMKPWAEKWIALGLRTNCTDKPRAEDAIRRIYECAKIPWHGNVVWVKSPITCAFAGPIADYVLKSIGSMGKSKNVRGAVRDAVRGAVRGAVDGAVDGAVRGAVGSSWHRVWGGQWWVAFKAYSTFMRDGLGADLKEASKALDAECDSIHAGVGWWWPHSNFVIATESPTVLRLTNNRLHNESGPSIAWGDEWRLWHIEGVALDEQIVMRPQTQTIEQIDKETSNDIRAIRMQRFGLDRYLVESGAVVLDDCQVPIENTHEAVMRTRIGDVFMWPTCPSGRICPPLRVPREISTCEAARNWLHRGRAARVIART